jgi:hypothetical protein
MFARWWERGGSGGHGTDWHDLSRDGSQSADDLRDLVLDGLARHRLAPAGLASSCLLIRGFRVRVPGGVPSDLAVP